MTEKTFIKTDKKGHEETWTWEDSSTLIKFRQEQERLRTQDTAAGYDTEGK